MQEKRVGYLTEHSSVVLLCVITGRVSFLIHQLSSFLLSEICRNLRICRNQRKDLSQLAERIVAIGEKNYHFWCIESLLLDGKNYHFWCKELLLLVVRIITIGVKNFCYWWEEQFPVTLSQTLCQSLVPVLFINCTF